MDSKKYISGLLESSYIELRRSGRVGQTTLGSGFGPYPSLNILYTTEEKSMLCGTGMIISMPWEKTTKKTTEFFCVYINDMTPTD